MADTLNQGSAKETPAVPEEQGSAPATPADLGNLQQFAVPQEPTTPPAAPQEQGSAQGTPGTQEPQNRIAGLQSLWQQEQARRFAAEQRLRELETQRQAPQVVNQNPHDPQVNPVEYWRFENQRLVTDAVSQTRKEIIESLQGYAQANAEFQWQQNHPGVDLNMVKAAAQSRWGTPNVTTQMMDDVLTLMNIPNQIAAVRANTINETYQQFNRPQTGAQPVRGVQGGGPQVVGLRYEEMAKAYAQNPNIYDTWPKEVQTEFDKETDYRLSHR